MEPDHTVRVKDLKKKLIEEARAKHPDWAKRELRTAEAIRKVAKVGTRFSYVYTVRPIIYTVLEITDKGIRFEESDEGTQFFRTWKEIDETCEEVGGLFLIE